jgi:hypothetical protein
MKKTVILQHDNTQSHTARLTSETVTENSWEVVLHPPYNLDLAPSDYHLLGVLEDHKRGWDYKNDDAVWEAVCVVGCELLEWIYTTEVYLNLCSAVRNA